MYHVNQDVVIEVELAASFSGKMEVDERGVYCDVEDIKFSDYQVDIAGVSVMLSELPIELRDALFESARDQLDDMKWEI